MVTIKEPATNILKPWKPAPQREYIFTHATVIDPLDGSVHSDMTVCLAWGLIDSVSRSPADISKSHATVVDLSGKYICPGLIDCHVHLATPPGEQGLADTLNQDHTTSLLRQPFLARQMINRGFTTIRDCGGAGLAIKEAIAEGLYPGPRMFISGHGISQTGGHGDMRRSKDAEYECCGGHFNGLGRIADGVEQCLHAAREELRQGADFIKIMCSGGVVSPTDRLTNSQYTPEEIRAFTRVASDSGTYVTAHAYTPAAIRTAIENGVRGIEHGNLIDEPTAKLMAEKGAFLTPTLVTYDAMASREFEGFLPPNIATKNDQILQAGLKSIEIADQAGVTMCYGTDLLGPMQVRQTGEFGLRKQVLSSLKVLQSATVNAAKLLGQDSLLGRIRAGYTADLLILSRNPLDDIEMFDRDDGFLMAVIKDGRVVMSRYGGLSMD
ncbi:hypothetical protein MBLNU459_g4729t1 [Dothideomycetes sp. NU459]